MSRNTPEISLGISPCPNDTYIFHALLHDCLDLPFRVRLHMADVEELNALACRGELDVTKFSVGATAHIIDDYALLRSGAALGWGCGPLVVARADMDAAARATARVAIPGRMTTANLLLDLTDAFHGPREEMLFDAVMPAVLAGKADCGVIIHEGRFTYAEKGLVRLLDLGQWWEAAFAMPLPLGAIAAHRRLDPHLARAVEAAIRQSLDYANAHPEASRAFIRAHAQELSDSVTTAHIKTFVTDFSRELGTAGEKAIAALVERAARIQGRTAPLPPLFVA